jgi:hypothetical protein
MLRYRQHRSFAQCRRALNISGRTSSLARNCCDLMQFAQTLFARGPFSLTSREVCGARMYKAFHPGWLPLGVARRRAYDDGMKAVLGLTIPEFFLTRWTGLDR